MIWYQLNRVLGHYRRTTVDDGMGGRASVMTCIGDVWAKVSQPSARERTAAHQAGSELTHILHLAPEAGVRRGDELRDAAGTFRILDTISPSAEGVYLRADAEFIQAEEVI